MYGGEFPHRLTKYLQGVQALRFELVSRISRVWGYIGPYCLTSLCFFDEL